MNVEIFNVLQKGSASFRSVVGRQFIANINAIANVVSKSITETQFDYTTDPRFPSTAQRWVVGDDLTSIRQTISGNYNDGATITLTPTTINGNTNSNSYPVNVNNIRYGYADGGNVKLYILREGRPLLDIWQFNSTTLIAVANIINQATSNQLFTVTFGACTTSTQDITYDVNQAGRLLLERHNGASYVTIDTYVVSAGSGSHTFSFEAGDAISGNQIRVTLLVGTQFHPIAVSTFGCAGGSGSGSGITGDCNMYAYFDGDGWNNSLNTLNWGASCSLGYHLQVSTSSDFTDEDSYVVDADTKDTIMELTLTAGTYYARVRNFSGQTRYSPTLTFTAS